jgi:hypothetical protein
MFTLPSLERELAEQRAWLKSEHGLPQVRESVGDAPIDVVSFDVSRLLLADLNWKPRATLQGYIAYTPELLELNAECLSGARAPRFVLLDLRTIDLRLPAMDDGEVLKVLARDYRPVLIEDERLLLRHEPRAEPPSAPRTLIDRDIAFDELVEIGDAPGRCQMLALDIRFTLLGRLRKALLNAPRVMIELTTDAGERRRFRVVPAMMSTGVILNPLILGTDDWLRFGSGDALPRVTSVRLVQPGSAWMFEPQVRMRLMRADDLQPEWWIDLPPVPAPLPAERQPLTAVDAPIAGDRARSSVQALFPVPDPVWRIESGEPVRTVSTSTRTVTVVHAPGRAWIPVSAGRHRLSGEFGLAPLARQPGCDAKVTVSIVLVSDASRTTLLERDLDGTRAEDLKDVPIDVELESASPAWLWISTRDRGTDADCAWTYWGRLRLE